MQDEFIKYLKEKNLVKKNDRVLLAISGGIDSMVMAHLFLTAGIETGIAHCNFSLRGNESDGDEQLVRRYSVDNGIPFYSIRFDTKKYARQKKISIEMAARELRYEWFEKTREENGYRVIAVAHNMNDNTETMIINLARGTGIAGLTGMRTTAGRIIRPLLFATRSRIEEYCRTNKIDYREDSSNAETKFTRNKIRHLVIPVLRDINPSIEETLSRTAERLAGTNDLASRYIEGIRSRASIADGKNTVFRLSELKDVKNNDTVLFELFKGYGINSSTPHDLKKVINGRTGGKILTPTHRIIKNRDELIVSPQEEEQFEEFFIYDTVDFHDLPFIASAEILDRDNEMTIPDRPSIAFLDFRKLSFPLKVRRWVKGDSFFPLGMKNKKKLSDYFIDRKFPLIKKEKTLILESAGEIIWIIGERIDDRYKITPSTVTILRLELKNS
jgi:tRNA(Ile)-lysidine synthase